VATVRLRTRSPLPYASLCACLDQSWGFFGFDFCVELEIRAQGLMSKCSPLSHTLAFNAMVFLTLTASCDTSNCGVDLIPQGAPLFHS
jgi:hypothetical protein